MIAAHVDTRTGERWLRLAVVDAAGRTSDYADAYDFIGESSWGTRDGRYVYLSWPDVGHSDGSRFLEHVGLNEAAVAERGRTVRVPRRPPGAPTVSVRAEARDERARDAYIAKQEAYAALLGPIRADLTSNRPTVRKRGRRALAAVIRDYARDCGVKVDVHAVWETAKEAVVSGRDLEMVI